MASPTRKAPSSQRRLPSTLLMLGVLLITILNIGSAALLVKLTRNNATTTLRETAAVRSTDREQLRRPPRHAAARRFRKSGNQRETRNAIGVSGASVPDYSCFHHGRILYVVVTHDTTERVQHLLKSDWGEQIQNKSLDCDVRDSAIYVHFQRQIGNEYADQGLRNLVIDGIAEAIRNVQGEFDWVAIGDDDTLWFPNALQRFLMHYDSRQALAVGNIYDYGPPGDGVSKPLAAGCFYEADQERVKHFTGGDGILMSIRAARKVAAYREPERLHSWAQTAIQASDVALACVLGLANIPTIHASDRMLSSCEACSEAPVGFVMSCHAATVFRENNPHRDTDASKRFIEYSWRTSTYANVKPERSATTQIACCVNGEIGGMT